METREVTDPSYCGTKIIYSGLTEPCSPAHPFRVRYSVTDFMQHLQFGYPQLCGLDKVIFDKFGNISIYLHHYG